MDVFSPKTNNKSTPNKSLSVSDLTRHQKIHVEELYHSSSTGHVVYRQFSWQGPISTRPQDPITLFRKDLSCRFGAMSIEGGEPAPNIFDSEDFHSFNFSKPLPDDVEYKPQPNKSSETKSMRDVHEIDSKSSRPGKKVPKLDIEPNAKSKKLRRLVFETHEAAENRRSVRSVILFVTLPIFFVVAGLVAFDYDVEIEFDPNTIVEDLKSNLFGQDRAISMFSQVLDTISEDELIVFAGGTGVGKTYATSIVSRHFTDVHFYVRSKNVEFDATDIVTKLSDRNRNLIVIDTVEPDEIPAVVPFIEAVFATGKKSLILLVINVQKHSHELEPIVDLSKSRKDIENTLRGVGFDPVVIVFEPLEYPTLLKCIRKALSERRIKETEKAIESVVENVDVRLSGCKRVDSKVALLHSESGENAR